MSCKCQRIERETKIVELMAQGLPYKLIAHEIGVSRSTIKNRVIEMLQEYGCDNGVHLVATFLRRGYIE